MIPPRLNVFAWYELARHMEPGPIAITRCEHSWLEANLGLMPGNYIVGHPFVVIPDWPQWMAQPGDVYRPKHLKERGQ